VPRDLQSPVARPPETGVLQISGEVLAPTSLRFGDLRTLPQHEQDVSFTCRRSGPRHHRFTGPLLLDVARLAEPAFTPLERKDRLRFLIALRAADGHRVVLAWAEIDPEFAHHAILLGLTRDGRTLDEEGPQLVVPGDACGARNVSRIVELRVVSYTGE
jgi:hypothetical protein